jgi:hypothetical protein
MVPSVEQLLASLRGQRIRMSGLQSVFPRHWPQGVNPAYAKAKIDVENYLKQYVSTHPPPAFCSKPMRSHHWSTLRTKLSLVPYADGGSCCADIVFHCALVGCVACVRMLTRRRMFPGDEARLNRHRRCNYAHFAATFWPYAGLEQFNTLTLASVWVSTYPDLRTSLDRPLILTNKICLLSPSIIFFPHVIGVLAVFVKDSSCLAI